MVSVVGELAGGASERVQGGGLVVARPEAAVLSAGVSETTIYVGSLLEKVTNNNGTAYRHYVPIGNSEVVYNRWTSGTNSVYYLTMDHLGSTASVMNSSGNAVVRENFAAGGARRGDNWTGKPTTAELTTIDGVTHRGFTFQERLDNLNLTDFNGRMYGETGQFFSPDPYIGDPSDTQSYNRYSYVLNSPLSRMDPTGYFSLGDLLNPFSSKNPLNPFGREGRLIALAPFDPHAGNTLLREHPWLQMVAEIVACEYGGPYACGATSAYMTRLDGGDWLQTLEAGNFAFAFYNWDAGMDATPDWLNYPTMPVAAFVTYGALIGKNVYNITPWLNIKWPSYRD